MSLKVWLPLDGDLRNLGCSDYNISTIETTPTYTSGKIGQCYQRIDSNTQSTKGININNNLLDILGTEASIAVWVKPLGTHTHYNGTIVSSGNWNAKKWAFGVSQDNSQVDVLCGGYNNYITCAVPVNEWTHLVSTFNNGVCKLYKNGVYIGEKTGQAAFVSDASNACIGRETYASGYFGFNGCINDVRIYDHCLSAAEVHEIAQGLVLHYKLDGEVTTAKNLIKNGYGELGTTNWSNSVNFSSEVPPNHPEIKKSIYSNITIEYIPIESTHNYKLEAYLKNSATSGYTYPSLYPYDIDKNFISNYQCSAGFNLTTMTTLKQELKSGDTKIYVNDLSKWNANSGHYYNYAAIFSYSDSTGYIYQDGTYTRITPAFGSGTNAKTNLDKTNNIITLNTAYSGPTKPAGTAVCAATDGNTYYYPFGGLEKSSLNNWAYQTATIIPNNITRLKYAKYIHYSTYDGTLHAGIKLIDLADDIDSTIISDSSGYGHNGTIINAPTISSDTSKYSSSINFNGTTDGILIENLNISNIINTAVTYSFWIKPNGENGMRSVYFGSYSGTSWSIEKTSGNLLRSYWNGSPDETCSNATITDGVWQHICIVKNGTNSIKAYINGVQKWASTATHSNLTFPTTFRIGRDSRSNDGTPYKGQMSDFRIYCTPLLDNDIKMLYNIGMRVDNLQNLHTFEYKENTSNLFRSELIMPWAKANRTRIGEIVLHNNAYALNIGPEPFYKNISDSVSGALDGMFIQNTSYVFDMWIDTDSVIYNNNNVLGGMTIRYSDNSTDSTLALLGGNKGYQHKVLITPSNKTIQRLEFYYYTNTDVFYRIDSCICPLNNLKIQKVCICEGTNIIENINTKFIKNALIETNQLIEI